jgi:hypothetical protein
MDASQLWCPEIVHSSPKHQLSSFYVHKVSEVLRNSPIYHFGSNGVEWMLLNFGTSNWRNLARNTSFLIFTYTRLAKCSVTLSYIICGQME